MPRLRTPRAGRLAEEGAPRGGLPTRRDVTQGVVTLRDVTLRDVTLRGVTLRDVTLRHVALRHVTGPPRAARPAQQLVRLVRVGQGQETRGSGAIGEVRAPPRRAVRHGPAGFRQVMRTAVAARRPVPGQLDQVPIAVAARRRVPGRRDQVTFGAAASRWVAARRRVARAAVPAALHENGGKWGTRTAVRVSSLRLVRPLAASAVAAAMTLDQARPAVAPTKMAAAGPDHARQPAVHTAMAQGRPLAARPREDDPAIQGDRHRRTLLHAKTAAGRGRLAHGHRARSRLAHGHRAQGRLAHGRRARREAARGPFRQQRAVVAPAEPGPNDTSRPVKGPSGGLGRPTRGPSGEPVQPVRELSSGPRGPTASASMTGRRGRRIGQLTRPCRSR